MRPVDPAPGLLIGVFFMKSKTWEVDMSRGLKSDLLRVCVVFIPIGIVGVITSLIGVASVSNYRVDENDYAYRVQRAVVPSVYPLKVIKVTQETLDAARGDTQYDLITVEGPGVPNPLQATPELSFESWQYLLGQLKPEGILSYTLPESSLLEAHIYRLISLGYSSLVRMGVKEPRMNMIVVKNQHTAIIIVGRKALSDEFLINTEMLNIEKGLQVVVSPFIEETLTISWLVSPATHLSVVNDYGSDISAPDHNRPFFFQTYKVSRFSMTIMVIALVCAPAVFYRVFRGGHRKFVSTSEYLILYQTTLAILSATLLLRLQSYIPLSGTALASGVFGSQFAATLIWSLLGIKSETRGTRGFFVLGAIVSLLMACVMLFGILPLLAATGGLYLPAKVIIASCALFLLMILTTWPVLGIGTFRTEISGRQVVSIVCFLTLVVMSNVLVTRFLGISEAILAIAVVMLGLVREAHAIRATTRQLTTAVAPNPARLVVEQSYEPPSNPDRFKDLTLPGGLAISDHTDDPSLKGPDILVS